LRTYQKLNNHSFGGARSGDLRPIGAFQFSFEAPSVTIFVQVLSEEYPMSKFTLAKALLALALLTESAAAADLPSRKGPPPVFVPPPPLWTGFYVGLNAGYGWGANTNASIATGQLYDVFGAAGLDPLAVNSALSASAVRNVQDNGFIGGGQIGYNYQWRNDWVIGLEADIQGAAIRGDNAFGNATAWNVFNLGAPAAVLDQRFLAATFDRSALTSTDISKHTDWLGTVRARVGWLATPTLLIYGTGGLAYGGVQARVFQSQTINNLFTAGVFGIPFVSLNLPYSGASSGNYQDTRVGWTAGGGFEWMFLPNWSLKAEALYYDLGSVTFANSPIAAFGPSFSILGATILPPISTVNQGATRVHFDGVIARAGVNYHFNWGAIPTIAY
jgi:outer membrane immunogenic protein